MPWMAFPLVAMIIGRNHFCSSTSWHSFECEALPTTITGHSKRMRIDITDMNLGMNILIDCAWSFWWMKFRYSVHTKSVFVSTVPVYLMERALHIWNVDDSNKWDPIYGVHQKYIWRSSQQTCSKTTRKTRDFGNMLQHVGWELRQIYS